MCISTGSANGWRLARDRAEGSGAAAGLARADAGSIRFSAHLIALDEVRDWSRDAQGNVRHKTGQFFGVQGVRIESGNLREVASWDQPIYTQPEGGILALLARETRGDGVQFLLNGKPEPGNIGIIQFSPTIQSTWSNIRRAHAGRRPPMVRGAHRRTRRAVRLSRRAQ